MAIRSQWLHTVIVLVLSNPAFVFAVDGDASNKVPPEDHTGILYDKIIDYLDGMNVVQEQRYCVLAKGSRTKTTDNGIQECHLIRLLAVEPNRKLRLIASAFVWEPFGKRTEVWSQALVNNGITTLRKTTPSLPDNFDEKYNKTTPKDEIPEVLVNSMTPFDDVVRMAHGMEENSTRESGLAEKMFLHGGPSLVSADFDKQGDIFSIWRNSSVDYTVSTEITFAKRQGYRPTKVRYYISKDGKSSLLSDSLATWTKVGEHWLPLKQLATWLKPKAGENHYELNYSWKLEDEVPEGLIRLDNPDWREPFRLLYNEDWIRRGRGIIRLPEELQLP